MWVLADNKMKAFKCQPFYSTFIYDDHNNDIEPTKIRTIFLYTTGFMLFAIFCCFCRLKVIKISIITKKKFKTF